MGGDRKQNEEVQKLAHHKVAAGSPKLAETPRAQTPLILSSMQSRKQQKVSEVAPMNLEAKLDASSDIIPPPGFSGPVPAQQVSAESSSEPAISNSDLATMLAKLQISVD